jgi:hypothetical protein
MEAAAALGDGDGVSLHDLRTMVGAEVEAETAGGHLEGTLLSCTARSAWIVAGDEDHVLALPTIHSIHRH